MFEHWRAVELDMHEVFGIDCESGVLEDRTWRWFECRVMDLLERPGARIAAAVRA